MLDYSWYQLAANGASLDELNADHSELLGHKPDEGSDINHDLEELRRLTGGCNKSKQTNSPSATNNTSLSPVLLQGTPFIVYSLQDYEILEDLYSIKMQNKY